MTCDARISDIGREGRVDGDGHIGSDDAGLTTYEGKVGPDDGVGRGAACGEQDEGGEREHVEMSKDCEQSQAAAVMMGNVVGRRGRLYEGVGSVSVRLYVDRSVRAGQCVVDRKIFSAPLSHDHLFGARVGDRKYNAKFSVTKGTCPSHAHLSIGAASCRKPQGTKSRGRQRFSGGMASGLGPGMAGEVRCHNS